MPTLSDPEPLNLSSFGRFQPRHRGPNVRHRRDIPPLREDNRSGHLQSGESLREKVKCRGDFSPQHLLRRQMPTHYCRRAVRCALGFLPIISLAGRMAFRVRIGKFELRIRPARVPRWSFFIRLFA